MVKIFQIFFQYLLSQTILNIFQYLLGCLSANKPYIPILPTLSSDPSVSTPLAHGEVPKNRRKMLQIDSKLRRNPQIVPCLPLFGGGIISRSFQGHFKVRFRRQGPIFQYIPILSGPSPKTNIAIYFQYLLAFSSIIQYNT